MDIELEINLSKYLLLKEYLKRNSWNEKDLIFLLKSFALNLQNDSLNIKFNAILEFIVIVNENLNKIDFSLNYFIDNKKFLFNVIFFKTELLNSHFKKILDKELIFIEFLSNTEKIENNPKLWLNEEYDATFWTEDKIFILEKHIFEMKLNNTLIFGENHLTIESDILGIMGLISNPMKNYHLDRKTLQIYKNAFNDSYLFKRLDFNDWKGTKKFLLQNTSLLMNFYSQLENITTRIFSFWEFDLVLILMLYTNLITRITFNEIFNNRNKAKVFLFEENQVYIKNEFRDKVLNEIEKTIYSFLEKEKISIKKVFGNKTKKKSIQELLLIEIPDNNIIPLKHIALINYILYDHNGLSERNKEAHKNEDINNENIHWLNFCLLLYLLSDLKTLYLRKYDDCDD